MKYPDTLFSLLLHEDRLDYFCWIKAGAKGRQLRCLVNLGANCVFTKLICKSITAREDTNPADRLPDIPIHPVLILLGK